MTLDHTASAARPELSDAKRALLERRLRGQAAGTAGGAIVRRAERDRAPLSLAQRCLWFFSQLDSNSALYNVPVSLRLEGPLNLDALRESLERLVARHESLRTQFLAETGEPVQVIRPPAPVPLPLTDLGNVPEAEQSARLDAFLRTEWERPFDLTSDLMLRGAVARLGPTTHVLVLVMHHLASDAWSWGVFFRELTASYGACAAGRPTPLPELPLQYADYAVWQQAWLRSPAMAEQLAYWKDHLAGAPPCLELPTDHPRPRVQSFQGGWKVRPLAVRLRAALQELSRAEGATLFMTLLAAFEVLLHRYTRQSELVVGIPVAGRTQVQTEPLIGFFVNTLPLRGRLGGNPTFLELLRQVRETTLAALSNQELPFEKLVEELRPARSSSYSPLVQAMFVLHTPASHELRLPGITATPIDAYTETSKFDLTVAVEESDAGLIAGLEYATDLFQPETAERILAHYETLLTSIATRPAQRIDELPLLTGRERHQLLVEWNATRTEYPRDMTIHQRFEAQAARTPEATAVVFQAERLTYRQLDQRANRLAHRLRALGVGPDVPVALCAERSPAMIVALLAILKAGGAYVSLDPSYPKERLGYMLRECDPPVVLVERALQGALPDLAPREGAEARPAPCVLGLDDPDDTETSIAAGAGAGDPAQPPESGATAEHLAYISYTSGSTGRPKGVCIPHRAVARLLLGTNYIQIEPDDAFGQIANCAFDASTFEIWGALLHGARVVILPRSVVLSPPAFAEAIAAHGITTMFVTAALFNQSSQQVPGMFRTMRHLLVGGEALNAASIRAVLQTGPPQRLLNGYGPTEVTTFAVTHEIRSLEPEAVSVPIGRPIANTEAYILDEHQQPVPVGVAGELYLGGDGLARGYYRQPELTAQAFVPHPFSSKPGARLYRTGDLVRYRPDGTIEFIGRTDFQVKIRGFRIELGEIEAVLAQHPAVRESVVTVIEDEANDKRLAAYVVAQGEGAPGAEALRSYARTQLPEYMVPATVTFLPALTLNANGKVDRAALPAPASARDAAPEFARPNDDLETQVAAIWEDLLRVRPIGRHDHFFGLGGHSLLAVRLMARIAKTFGRTLPVTTVFQAPTLAEFCERLMRAMRPAVKEGARRAVPAGSSLVEIQGQGTRLPLYLVHGAGGGMFWGYTNLARHLGADQPVYAFQSRGWRGQAEFATIPAMAAQYVADLRAFQPRGPYHLGGYCFGGNVAAEMARQLIDAGDEVALLAVLNSVPPDSSYERARPTAAWLGRFIWNLGFVVQSFAHRSAAERRQFFRWQLNGLRKRVARLFGRKAPGPEIQPDEVIDLSGYPPEQRPVWEAHIRALIAHTTRRYPGRVTLLRSRGHPMWCSFDPTYGWNEFVAEVAVHRVPGAHEQILDEPHVGQLAEVLRHALQEAAPQPRARVAAEDASPGPAAPSAAAPVPELPLGFAQERLWLLDHLEPGTAIHHVPVAIRLHGLLDRLALQEALDLLVRRHDVLRSTVSVTAGQPRLAVHPTATVRWRAVDLGDKVWNPHGLTVAVQEAQRPFDLSRDHPLRVALLEFTDVEHVLLLIVHAMALDVDSVDRLLGELVTLYESCANRRPVTLPQPPFPYVEVARWQRRTAQTEAAAADLQYWRDRLAGTPAIPLPTDHPQPARPSRRGARQSLTLSREMTGRLRDLGQGSEATLFVTLLSAFAVLLHRHTGATDFAIGSPVHRSMPPEAADLIGNFSYTRALRPDLGGDPTFETLLGRVRQTVRDAEAHEAVPFERVLDELPRERDRSRHPVFQVSFELAPAVRKRRVGTMTWTPFDFGVGVAPLDLRLRLHESEAGLEGWFEYGTDLFTTATIHRWRERWMILLEGILAHPERRISQLPLLTPAEMRQVLSDWNATTTSFPHGRCAHELFDEQAARAPERLAVAGPREQLTYRELGERARAVARHLQLRQLPPRARLGIAMDSGSVLLASLLAIWKAGHIGVPLSPAEPRECLRQQLATARVALVLTRPALRGQLELALAPIYCMCVDDGPRTLPEGGSRPDGNPEVLVAPSDLAYVVHASASADRPHPLGVPHRALVNLATWRADASRLPPGARTLPVGPDFAVMLQAILSTWVSSGTVVMVEESVQRNPEALLRALTEHQVQRLFLPAAELHPLAEALQADTPIPARLREIIVTGEPVRITPAIVRFFEQMPDCVLESQYGTEGTQVATAFTLVGPARAWPTHPPIGRPIANAHVYVLDPAGQPAPVGVPGELFVGGASLASGYLDDHDLTAERFVPDPFRPGAKTRLHRTGDRARWLPDGNLELCAPASAPRPTLSPTPPAKPADRTAPEPGAGREALLAGMPSTPDAAASPVPPKPARGASSPERPRTPAEHALARLWQALLHRDRVEPGDHFFDLGGHSLLAVRLAALVKQSWGLDLPVAVVLERPILAEQAAYLEAHANRPPVPASLLEVQPNGTRLPLFLVHGAGGGMLWGYANLARHLGPDQPVYAFHSRALAGMDEFPTIDAMAAQYATELQNFQPHGPYALGGYSFGGNVAYAMACRLEQQGETVALLALINSRPPHSSYDRFRLTPAACLRFVANATERTGHLLRQDPDRRRAFLSWKARGLRRKCARLVSRQGGRPRLDPGDYVDLSRQPPERQAAWTSHARAYWAYHPEPYGGALTLIRTRDHPLLCSFDDACGWRELARGGVTVRVVPGAHETVLEEPHAQAVAGTLVPLLQSASASLQATEAPKS